MNRSMKILLLVVIYFCSTQFAYSQLKEQEIKSVLIERFSRFMTWTETPSDTVFKIEVLGNREMYEIIKKTYAKRFINSLPVQVSYIEDLKEPSDSIRINCQILYLGDCYKTNIKQYTFIYQSAGAMVIGHEANCIKTGATLAFVEIDNKIKFTYDQESVSRSKVKISYKLLQLAKTK